MKETSENELNDVKSFEDWKKMPLISMNINGGPNQQLFQNGDLALRRDTNKYVEVK